MKSTTSTKGLLKEVPEHCETTSCLFAKLINLDRKSQTEHVYLLLSFQRLPTTTLRYQIQGVVRTMLTGKKMSHEISVSITNYPFD